MTSRLPPTPLVLRLALCTAAASLLALTACNRSDATATVSPGTTKTAGAATAAATPATPELWKLQGRWLRPDGGYILAIGPITDDGRAEANYFNPSPIRVAWARARPEGGNLKIDVELRDHNYPGCLYKLTYMPQNDQLVGTYFQAQMHETHEVFFVRSP